MSRLKETYHKTIKEELKKKFDVKNIMLVPKLRKVVINMGIAEATKDKNILQDHIVELSMISGQKPLVTKAKKSIANFKLREGQAIGLKVTLRGTRMYDFVDRLVSIVIPRIRDFRGLSDKGDGRGGYTFGLNDQQVYPEVILDKVKRQQGMDITFVTSADSDEECIELLRLLGMPFKNRPVVVHQ